MLGSKVTCVHMLSWSHAVLCAVRFSDANITEINVLIESLAYLSELQRNVSLASF